MPVLGQQVHVWVDSKQWESVEPNQKYSLGNDAIQLEVRKVAGKLSGRVQDDNGNPIPNAQIDLDRLPGMTNSGGHFEFLIPGDRLRPQIEIDAATIAKLQEERTLAKAVAEKASAEFAKNQPGQASEIYQEAERLYLAGKIDEAIKLLDGEKSARAAARVRSFHFRSGDRGPDSRPKPASMDSQRSNRIRSRLPGVQGKGN